MLLDTRVTAQRQALNSCDYVFGVIDDPLDAILAIEALHRAGFAGPDLLVQGPADYAGVRIATTATPTGRHPSEDLAVQDDTLTLWARLQDQVRAGHTVIQVCAPDPDEFDRALEILEESRAHAL